MVMDSQEKIEPGRGGGEGLRALLEPPHHLCPSAGRCLGEGRGEAVRGLFAGTEPWGGCRVA